MQGIESNRDFLLELAAVLEDDLSLREDPAVEVIEIDLFQDHTAVALPPDACGQIGDDVVAVEDVEDQAPAGLESLGDPLGDALVGVVVEEAERREDAVGAVELAVVAELAHVPVDEVDRQAAALRLVGAAEEE